MRRDHDYVLMSDYRADMDALGDDAAQVAEALKAEIDEARAMLARVVKASGGVVVLHRAELQATPPPRLVLSWDDTSDALILRSE